MTKYIYEALKDNIETVNGEVEALSPRDARDKIRQMGLVPLKVYNPDLVSDEKEIKPDDIGTVKSLSLSDKILFTSELQVLLSASIPIVEALYTVEINSPKPKMKRVAAELKNAVMNGMTFTDALSRYYYNVFGDTYIDLCRAGEMSGELDVTMLRLLTILKKQDNIKGRVIQASIYPVILIIIMFGVLLLFSKVVFPIFAGIVNTNGTDLPCFANSVFGLLKFVGDYWLLCLIGILASIGLFNIFATNDSTRSFFDKWFLTIPILNEFVRYISLSNYMCVLQISYDAGVPYMKCLDMATRTVNNTEIKKQAVAAKNYAGQGKVLSEAFSLSHLLPGPFVTMVASGEKAGNLGKMLNDIVEVIDKKVDMVIESLTRAFEPLMIVIMGLFTLIIATAFFQMYASATSSFM